MNSTTSLRKFFWAGLAFLAALAAALVLFGFDPAQHSFYPRCLFHEFTGLNCPGCGALRALHHLAHGELRVALHFNPLVVLAGPVIVWGLMRKLWARNSQFICSETLRHPRVAWSAVWIVLIFGVVRNLPFAPFNYLAL